MKPNLQQFIYLKNRYLYKKNYLIKINNKIFHKKLKLKMKLEISEFHSKNLNVGYKLLKDFSYFKK